jgi:hypothetical protein
MIYIVLIEVIISDGFVIVGISHASVFGITPFLDGRNVTIVSNPDDALFVKGFLAMMLRLIVRSTKNVASHKKNVSGAILTGYFALFLVGILSHLFEEANIAICCDEDS